MAYQENVQAECPFCHKMNTLWFDGRIHTGTQWVCEHYYMCGVCGSNMEVQWRWLIKQQYPITGAIDPDVRRLR